MRPAFLALILALAGAVSAMPHDFAWVHVPGGALLHRSCVHHVPEGWRVDRHPATGQGMLVGPNGEKRVVPRCAHRSAPRSKLPTDQIYAIDTHYVPATELMYSMNTTWVTPGLPTDDQGQINYLWPGFKSTEPTMGLPVLQPVLQYGQDCGQQWCVKGWFVWGDQGQAFQSTAVMLNVGDEVTSYMELNNDTQQWTIYAKRTSTGEQTALNIARSQACDCDYHVAMLVLETIMPPNTCDLLPSTPCTFTNVIVNGHAQEHTKWVQRVQMHDCNDQIKMTPTSTTFSWSNSATDAGADSDDGDADA